MPGRGSPEGPRRFGGVPVRSRMNAMRGTRAHPLLGHSEDEPRDHGPGVSCRRCACAGFEKGKHLKRRCAPHHRNPRQRPVGSRCFHGGPERSRIGPVRFAMLDRKDAAASRRCAGSRGGAAWAIVRQYVEQRKRPCSGAHRRGLGTRSSPAGTPGLSPGVPAASGTTSHVPHGNARVLPESSDRRPEAPPVLPTGTPGPSPRTPTGTRYHRPRPRTPAGLGSGAWP